MDKEVIARVRWINDLLLAASDIEGFLMDFENILRGNESLFIFEWIDDSG